MSNQPQDQRRTQQMMYASWGGASPSGVTYTPVPHATNNTQIPSTIPYSNSNHPPNALVDYPTGYLSTPGSYAPVQTPSQAFQYYYPPPQMTQPGSFPHPPPRQLTSADSGYSQSQSAPPTWAASQQGDPRLFAPSYSDVQQSGTPLGYALGPLTPSPTSDGWPETQSGSGMSSQIDVRPAPTRDTSRRGLASLADAPDNNTGHPGYAIKVLAEFAIKGSATGRMSLNDIYLAVEERYPGFRSDWGANWRNSARHDISMDPRFIKVPRRPDEPGRGGLWTYNPDVPPKPPTKRSSRTTRSTNSLNASASTSNSRPKDGTSPYSIRQIAADWNKE